jgi:CDP-glycerol glycerophosphotransferase (TagB/SpsB family)
LAPDLKIAFLQHGVIKDNLSSYLHRARFDLSIFVTTAARERQSIVGEDSYGFDHETVVLSGLPRHDLLKNKRGKIITFMPTWRSDLFNGWDPKTGKGLLKDGLEQSAFFRHLQSPLTSRRLLDAADRMGYSIHFFPHPVWQPYLDRFVFDPRVSTIPATTRYRDVFARSACCVTDWSSSIFDFVWLGKPVVYYQPDADNHYETGYFEYERDGFGPVFKSADKLIDHLIYMMERDCPMEEPYRTRAMEFFAFPDKNNCRRVTEAILAASTHESCNVTD